MPRSLTQAAYTALFAQETGDGLLVLLTLSSPEMTAPLRLVANGADVTSRGHLFNAYPFDLVLPDDVEDTPPRAQVRFDNVSRELIPWIRGLQNAPTALIELVKISAPDVVEVSIANLIATAPTYDVNQITVTLAVRDDTQHPCTKDLFSPSLFGGLSFNVRSA
jgi:hypothetical protein